MPWPRDCFATQWKDERGLPGACSGSSYPSLLPTELNDARVVTLSIVVKHQAHASTGALAPDGNCDVVELSRVH